MNYSERAKVVVWNEPHHIGDTLHCDALHIFKTSNASNFDSYTCVTLCAGGGGGIHNNNNSNNNKVCG